MKERKFFLNPSDMETPGLIKVRAPVRISFSGGGTDLSEYFLNHEGCVLSTTINKYVTVALRKTDNKGGILVYLESFKAKKILDLKHSTPQADDPFSPIAAALTMFHITSGLEVAVSSDLKPANGLGTSSALTVALISGLCAVKGVKVTKGQIAQKAVFLERDVLHRAGGFQDQYAASFGGFNLIEFHRKGTVSVSPVRVSAGVLKSLEKNLLLYQLKGSRNSSMHQDVLIRSISQNEKATQALHILKSNSYRMKDALSDGKFMEFAKILHENWILKKRSSPVITNSQIDHIYQTALQGGAIGGKLLGAGGGGCLLFYCPVQFQKRVKDALLSAGGEFIDITFEDKGVHVL
jgi:D-glycero-alpha-D-manno-heptose-7-phosphate kinase